MEEQLRRLFRKLLAGVDTKDLDGPKKAGDSQAELALCPQYNSGGVDGGTHRSGPNFDSTAAREVEVCLYLYGGRSFFPSTHGVATLSSSPIPS